MNYYSSLPNPSNSPQRPHICLAIDNEILRMGTAAVLRRNSFEVHEGYGDESDIAEQAYNLRSRIIISDKRREHLLSLNSVLAKNVCAPALIAVDLIPDEELLNSGVAIYLENPFTAEILLLGIECAMERSFFFSTNQVLNGNSVSSEGEAVQKLRAELQMKGLSERELQVLRKLASGLSNKEVGEELFVSTETVKSHLHNLLRKLGVRNRTQLVSKFLQSSF